VAPPPARLSFGEMPPFSIEALRGEMDNLLAWSDQLCVELDIGTAHRNVQVERLLNANREMSVRVDQLQDKFDHFIDEHWRPMQHFACGVVSCLAVFAGDSSFEPPFDVGTRSEPGAPFCHDFRRFPTFLCLSPKRPHSFTQSMTCFPFPFPHDPYLIFHPTFYLIFLFGHFRYQGQVRSIWFTR